MVMQKNAIGELEILTEARFLSVQRRAGSGARLGHPIASWKRCHWTGWRRDESFPSGRFAVAAISFNHGAIRGLRVIDSFRLKWLRR